MTDCVSTNAIYYPNESYISHHGVKGMRWGIRRYQNEDGSLTSAGQRRYAIQTARGERDAAKYRSRESTRRLNEAGGRRAGRDFAREYDKHTKQAEKDALAYMDAEARYRGAKSKNADKAERQYYARQMRKFGLSGSATDMSNGRSGTKFYDHLATTRGESYAKSIEDTARKQLYVELGASVALVIGAQAVQMYMANKY